MNKLGFFIFPIVLLVCAGAHAETDPCENFSGKRITSRAFVGLDQTHDYVVERELLNQVGKPLDCAHWATERGNLDALDIFSDVSLRVQVDSDDAVEVSYVFKELPQQFFFPAVKATDVNGVMMGAGSAAINVFGHDIRADTYVRTSVSPAFNATEFQVWMSAPWFLWVPVKWEFLLTQVNSNNPAKLFVENAFSAELDIYQHTGLPLYILYTADFFSIVHDETTPFFEPGDGTSRPFFLSDGGRDHVPKLGLGFVLDTREQIANAHYGHYLEFRWSQYGGPLGGPADYQEFLTDYRGYTTFASKHIFHTSVLGQYRPGTVGPYDFFHVGGTNSLRGYGIRPENYGQHEFLGTFEYRYEAAPRDSFEFWGDNLYYGLQWVAGVDTAWLWAFDESRPKPLYSAYVGFHLLFPFVERVRIELGVGELGKGTDDLIYALTIGAFEKSFFQRERLR